MKKLLLTCTLLGLAAAANAQPGPGPAANHPSPNYAEAHGRMWDPAAQAEHLKKSLQLSDEQTEKVKKIFEDSAAQHKALDEKYKPQLEAFHADMKKLREQTQTQLKAVLTPKQQEALKAQWQMREHRREHRGPMQGPMRDETAPTK